MSGTANPPTTDDQKTEPDPNPEPKPGDDGPTFGQEDLDAIAGKARSQGRSATLKEVADELGMSIEDAKKFIADKKAEDREKLDENERLRVEAEELRQQAAQQLAEAQAATLRANVSMALNQAGEDTAPVRSDRSDLATDLAIRYSQEAPDGEDPAVWAAAKVRETTPEWFRSSESTDPITPPSAGGTPRAGGSPAPSGADPKPVDTKSKYQEWKDRNKIRPLKST